MSVKYEGLRKMLEEVSDDIDLTADVTIELEDGLYPVESVRVADSDFESVERNGTLVLVVKKTSYKEAK